MLVLRASIHVDCLLAASDFCESLNVAVFTRLPSLHESINRSGFLKVQAQLQSGKMVIIPDNLLHAKWKEQPMRISRNFADHHLFNSGNRSQQVPSITQKVSEDYDTSVGFITG